MLRESRRSSIVGEPRRVVKIRGDPTPPGQVRVSTHAQGVPLVVIEQEQIGGWRKKRQAACSFPPPFGELVRIGEMHSTMAQQHRRFQTDFPSGNARPLYRQRQKDVRVAELIVVEEVARMRVKTIAVQCPAAEGNRDPELIFFVTFSTQRRKSKPLSDA